MSHCHLPNWNTQMQHFSNFVLCFFPPPGRKYNEFDWFMRRVENEKVIFLTCQKASKAVQLDWFLFCNFSKPPRTLFVKFKNCKIAIKSLISLNHAVDLQNNQCTDWQIFHLSNLQIKQRSFLRIWRLDSSPLESSKVLGQYVWNFPIQHQATKNNRSGRL